MSPALLAVLLAVPGARAAEAVTLRDAVAAAVGTRLDAVAAGERAAQARSRARERAAAILPQLTGSVSEVRTYKENLAALGFSLPGLSSELGPFDTFDARLRLTQKLFDWGAGRRARAGAAEAGAASAEEAAAREQVAAAAALAYLEAVKTRRGLAAAQADADVAARLLAQARDRKDQGAATGVDVVRAQAREADADAALLRARVAQREAVLLLDRVTGWPYGRELELADDFRAPESSAPAADDAVAAALSARPELSAARGRADAARYAAQAALGDRLPSAYVAGEAARSGAVPSDAKTVSSLGGYLSVPLFGGGAAAARQAEAESRRRQADAELDDARRQVELDARVAVERLAETAAEERAAELSLGLAQRELTMSQDRYGAGVGSAVEVVEAQAELARARAAQVNALARYHASRVNYAAAVGRASQFSL